MTLGNSIVLSSSIRPFGIRVSGCSPAMEVSHLHHPYVTDKIWISPRNGIKGFSMPLPTSMTSPLSWRPYQLEKGCEGKLNLADVAFPQLRILANIGRMMDEDFTQSEGRFMDPRPTNAVLATRETDEIPYKFKGGAYEAFNLPYSLERHLTRTDQNATFPGAFTDQAASLWFSDWSTLSARLPSALQLATAFAKLAVYTDGTCAVMRHHMVMRQQVCYR